MAERPIVSESDLQVLDSMDAVELGQRIRQARRARGLTQREIAEPEFSVPYISRIEAGERRPSTAALSHFASRMGMTLPELMRQDGEVNVGLQDALARRVAIATSTWLRSPSDKSAHDAMTDAVALWDLAVSGNSWR
ncbi:helix-turn-helix domain-containing protein [Pimelobacter simplex]|uniref:helix-turn-helix domain-containing protein n=1 Tax=Nocardioides simplex TaxID=2045 RepID=UPI00214F80BD|nr:helix-turn-helix transcriptional regulator [Pimelobacter simplex]UUW88347.1 helix-turn-helix domain-containing protein [Pimelobacter simplex]UUW97851.1 helix-turn-helix domain-containing protein [Pimelobacter simplex]